MQQFLLQHWAWGWVILWRQFESINFWLECPWVLQQPISFALSQQARRHTASFSFSFSYRTSEHLSSALSGESVLCVLARAGSISSILGSACSFMGFTHAEGDLCAAGCLNLLNQRDSKSQLQEIQRDTGRIRETQRDTERLRETQGDSGRQRETQGDSERLKET